MGEFYLKSPHVSPDVISYQETRLLAVLLKCPELRQVKPWHRREPAEQIPQLELGGTLSLASALPSKLACRLRAALPCEEGIEASIIRHVFAFHILPGSHVRDCVNKGVCS